MTTLILKAVNFPRFKTKSAKPKSADNSAYEKQRAMMAMYGIMRK